MEKQQLDGLWSYTAYEIGGVRRTPEEVAKMAKLVLLPGAHLPGWSGIWAVVSYGYEGGMWSEREIIASCRHAILGTERQGEAPASDFYAWARGRFRIAPQLSPKEIDFEGFQSGQVVPSSVQLGLYLVAEDRLALCLAGPGKPRPSGFNSTDSADQALGDLQRCEPRDNREKDTIGTE